ncbi:MAG TPA: SPOR domain-containing protein [Novosphingobium sp.]|nr:SPOR domain-containing protein [Novosphingobium sp.]
MIGTDGIRDDDEPVAGTPTTEWDNTADEPLETEQLALTDEEERLPWLESSDDEFADEGVDSGRIIGFFVLGVMALGLIVWAIWWFSHRSPDPALMADGSTIEAPATPYKEAPKDAGGKKFDGTGDSSFAVSEGQTRPAQLGGAKPAVDLAPKPGASVAAAKSGGVGVQVAAFSSQALAEAGWGKLVQQYSALSGVPHRVVAGKADIGTVYRLQAVASDGAAANALCGRLKSAGLSCQVK